MLQGKSTHELLIIIIIIIIIVTLHDQMSAAESKEKEANGNLQSEEKEANGDLNGSSGYVQTTGMQSQLATNIHYCTFLGKRKKLSQKSNHPKSSIW